MPDVEECQARSNPTGDESDRGFWCTLPVGHDGEHVAGTGSNGGIAARWPQAQPTPTYLGETWEDSISGWTGTATGVARYLDGTVQVQLTGKAEADKIPAVWVAAERLQRPTSQVGFS